MDTPERSGEASLAPVARTIALPIEDEKLRVQEYSK